MTQPEKKRISSEEYFEIEAEAEYKSEYYHGELFAMTGASHHHNVIAGNTFATLHTLLREKDCVVYGSDMKVQVDKDMHYAYPDISIVCGDIGFVDNRDDIITNPLVIIEVLSKSTRDYDRGTKFKLYRKLRTLHDYILIDQYACGVEYFFKNQEGKWSLEEFDNINNSFMIKSINAALFLKDIYYRVSL